MRASHPSIVLNQSPTATPANTRINSGSSSPVGFLDPLRIEAVLQGHYPSVPVVPNNTRACSPERDSTEQHSARQALETIMKLEDLAIARGRGARNKIFGSVRGLVFEIPNIVLNSSKTMLRKTPAVFNPTNAFKRDGLAADLLKKPVDMLSKVFAKLNPSTASKRDVNKATLVSITDGSAKISTVTKVKFLAFYFTANLGLTLYNKYIMLKHSSPYLLTALHCFAGVIGTQCLFRTGAFTIKPLTAKDKLKLTAFSVLYTVNIAISNASLDLVTVPFHQVVRAISPVFTIGIYHVFFGAVYSTQTYVSLIPVMFGVGLATYGDYNATVYGFLMTLAGAILAAVKTVITNRMQTSGLHLSALELLYRMSGPALIQSLIMAWYHGEFDLFGLEHPTMPDPMLCATLIVNGALAFALNYTSFSANKKAGALTMTVAANIKQILTVLFSYLLWDLRVSSLNVCGILLTLAAGAWYSAIELVGKKIEAGDVTRVAEEGSVEKK